MMGWAEGGGETEGRGSRRETLGRETVRGGSGGFGYLAPMRLSRLGSVAQPSREETGID